MCRLLSAVVIVFGLIVPGIAADKDKAEFTADTVCEIQIQDVSIADAPAKVIAKTTIKDLKEFPIKFEIEYDPTLIKDNADIAVSVRINTKGKLEYINDTKIAVITRNKPTKDVTVPVIKVKK